MHKKAILLVEDDVPVMELIRDALKAKYHVLPASTCVEAVEQSRNSIDLALLDYTLPDGDGLDLLKTIRKERQLFPVILMTGHSTEDLAIDALRLGVADYIRKPVSLEYLKSALSEILSEKWNSGGRLDRESDDAASMCILTLRESETLQWVKAGKNNFEIAAIMGLSENTVRTHLKKIFAKLEVHSRPQAVAIAIENGLLKSEAD